MPSTVTEVCIGQLSQIPRGQGRQFEIGGRLIAVFHLRNGGVHATQAACPHRGGPLADGLLTGQCVTCPLHGRKFDLQTGAQIGGEDTVTIHEIHERAGELWVRIAPLSQ
jgi:nitrite reductase (NADH) small subunit